MAEINLLDRIKECLEQISNPKEIPGRAGNDNFTTLTVPKEAARSCRGVGSPIPP